MHKSLAAVAAPLGVLATVSLFVPGCQPAPAETTKAAATFDPRDLSGVWTGGVAVDDVAAMTPVGQEKFDENRAELKNERPITTNPAFTCNPPGIPHAYNNGAFPFEIVQTPTRAFMFFESAHVWRPIWMDGREMPKESEPLWLGYSVGHWDGNDLLVDTTHFNDRTWLLAAGYPHSTALRVGERFHRVDAETLHITFTIDDPTFYTSPWTITGKYRRRPNWEIGEAFCVRDEQTAFQDVILTPNAKP